MARFIEQVVFALRELPLWVQVWIWPLSIVVALFPFLILYDPLGIIGLVNIVVILAGNVPLLVHYRGFVKAMGIAHVPGMCVIVVYGCMRFAGPVGDELQISPDVFEPRELFGVALSMVVVSGISLIFDVVDSFLWISGRNREVVTMEGTMTLDEWAAWKKGGFSDRTGSGEDTVGQHG